jgi:pimeloyl-ACP methyl ester carboxylesterase
MIMIETNGMRINYSEKGNGPDVVLIHGIPTDYRVWNELDELLSKDFHTISYSRRCSIPNQNKDCAASTVDNNEKDLEGLISRIGDRPVHLIGHSYGGAVAALFALKNPKKVRSLVLIEPFLLAMLIKNPSSAAQNLSFFLRKPSAALSGRRSMKNVESAVRELDKKKVTEALNFFFDSLHDPPYFKEKYSEKSLKMMNDNVENIREVLTPLPHFTKVEARRLTQPTLLITGERSSKVLKAIVGEMHRNLPKNELLTIPNAAHMPHLENPQECNQAILKFLKEQNQ